MNDQFWQAVVLIVMTLSVVTIVTVAIAVPVRSTSHNRREREQTKREIAAYVAEGTIPPETGVELMKAAAVGDVRDVQASIDRRG